MHDKLQRVRNNKTQKNEIHTELMNYLCSERWLMICHFEQSLCTQTAHNYCENNYQYASCINWQKDGIRFACNVWHHINLIWLTNGEVLTTVSPTSPQYTNDWLASVQQMNTVNNR